MQPTPETVTIGPAIIRWTDARHGNLGLTASDADRSRVVPGGWMYARQVHGNNVLVADGKLSPGEEGDAIVTRTPNSPIAVAVADCAPVALVGDDGTIAAVHAGWKGLRSHVISHAAESMRELGAVDIQGALGPCIHAECYEFGEEQLKGFVEEWGAAVAGRTSEGSTAFDLPAAVEAECAKAGISLVYKSKNCTGCSGQHFSYRKQNTTSRQVMVVETQEKLV